MAGGVESLHDLCARLERQIEESLRATTDNGQLQIRAMELVRLFGVFRAYGGRASWDATDENIMLLAPPVRRYIEALQCELVRIQKANLRFTAVQEPLPATATDLVDSIAREIDYAAFVTQAHRDRNETRLDRRRARDKAKAIIAMLIRRRCLVSFEAPPGVR